MHEIYLLTRQEWQLDLPDEVRVDGAVCPHRLAVLDALSRGLYVPSRVMADYPDLRQRYPQLFVKHDQAQAPGLGVGVASAGTASPGGHSAERHEAAAKPPLRAAAARLR